MTWMRKHPVTSFVLAAYVFAWGCWLYLYITTPPGGMQAGISPLFLLFALAGGLGPTLAALVLSRIVDGKGGAGRLMRQFSFTRGSPAWLLVSLLTVPALSAIALLVQVLLGRQVATGNILDRLGLGIVWPLFAAFGEEFGWRAFMLPRLQRRYSALAASLLVGICWGTWHLMADYIGLRSYGWLFVPYFLLAGPVLLTAHALIMTWIYNSTGNMAYIVLYHFTITSSAILLPSLTLDAAGNIVSAAIGAALFWIVALILILVNGPARLSKTAS